MSKVPPERWDSFHALREHIGYPDVPFPDSDNWEDLPSGYTAVEYTAPSVKATVSGGETTDLGLVWDRVRQISSCARLPRDPDTGLPLNPAGPTGIKGRGRLHYLGPNLSTDGIVTAEEMVLLIIRRDAGQLAFPGGFLNVQPNGEIEDSLAGARRETWEETNLHIIGGKSFLLRSGIAALSLRNTDNAWIENAAWWIQMPKGYHNRHTPKAKDDASEAMWLPVATIDPEKMSIPHAETLQRLKEQMELD